jgi:hypothetical protein
MRICNPQPFVSVPLFERIANPLSLAHRIANPIEQERKITF